MFSSLVWVTSVCSFCETSPSYTLRFGALFIGMLFIKKKSVLETRREKWLSISRHVINRKGWAEMHKGQKR